MNLINIEQFKNPISEKLLSIEKGIWAIDQENQLIDLEIPSSLLLSKFKSNLFAHGSTIFVSGIITDMILDMLRVQKNIKETTLVVKDFTKIFATPESFTAFVKKGNKIKVLLKTKLIAVCVNPVSPEGYVIDSQILQNALSENLGIPVYDVFKIGE